MTFLLVCGLLLLGLGCLSLLTVRVVLRVDGGVVLISHSCSFV